MEGAVSSNRLQREREPWPPDDYTDDEWEFARALRKFQDDNGVRYPRYSDVLQVLKSLGYKKADKSEMVQHDEQCNVLDFFV